MITGIWLFSRQKRWRLCSSARNDNIDELVQVKQLEHQSAIGVINKLHRFGRQTGLRERLLRHFRQDAIGMHRFLPATQDGGVSCFNCQPGYVNCDIGARFVNDTDHSKRNPPLP